MGDVRVAAEINKTVYLDKDAEGTKQYGRCNIEVFGARVGV